MTVEVKGQFSQPARKTGYLLHPETFVFEQRQGFPLRTMVTHHGARLGKGYTQNREQLSETFADIARDGIDDVRSDWDWDIVEKKQGEFSKEQLDHFALSFELMRGKGLEPVLILSNPPKWAKDLYKKGDKESFYLSFQNYAQKVAEVLEQIPGEPINEVQVLNELNSHFFNFVAVEDMPRLCQITRDVFYFYNPGIKLVASLLAIDFPDSRSGNILEGAFAEGIRSYLPKFKERALDSFDMISIDYYPGGWYRPRDPQKKLRDTFRKILTPHPSKKAVKEMFGDLRLLKEVLEEVSEWGKEYEINEVGYPVKGIYWGNERRQRYFYDVFARKFKHEILMDFRKRNKKLPSRVAFYQAENERPGNLAEKAKRLSPYPEFNWGMRDDEGNRNLLLQGSPHAAKDERSQQESRLFRIIHYLRVPMKENQNVESQQDKKDIEI